VWEVDGFSEVSMSVYGVVDVSEDRRDCWLVVRV
jgi:hypothetical protein